MKDAAIRAARTLAQSVTASLVLILTDALSDLSILTDTGRWALLALNGGIALVTFIQNWLEETRTVTYERG